MELRNEHQWPVEKFEAIELQKEFAQHVQILPNFDDVTLIAAVDTAYGRNADIIYASAVIYTFPEIDEVEKRFHYAEVKFPYTPGLLYFREGPAILAALEKLETTPDLIIVNGHGIADYNRCGLASMVGIAFDIPTIGCARKLIAGNHREITPQKGSSQPLFLKDREVGLAYRTKDNVKPLFISPGHRCDIKFAKEMVVQNLRGYRMPEPLRFAHQAANKYKRHIEKKYQNKTIYIKE